MCVKFRNVRARMSNTTGGSNMVDAGDFGRPQDIVDTIQARRMIWSQLCMSVRLFDDD